MGIMLRLIKDAAMPASGVRVIKAAELETLFSVQEAIGAAQKRAQEIESLAQEAYKNKEQEGYEHGLQESQMEYAEKMYAIAMKSVESIESLESAIVKVVIETVEKIIGELDDHERIARIVRTALNSVHTQQHVRVRVAVQDEKAVREALASMLSSSPGEAAFLDLVADPRLSPGSCQLESDLGVLDASLSTQLKALERAFSAKIQANSSAIR